MWKPKLNRHFTVILPALKISIFLVIWNALFHSLTLSILVYWSLTSTRVPDLNRMGTLNQFWSENQILFAALSTMGSALFFRDQLHALWKERRLGLPRFSVNFLRGVAFSAFFIGGLILSHRYEFLGFSAQLSLNFLTAYAWIFRAILLLLFVACNEFLTRRILREELRTVPSRLTRHAIETLTYLTVFWVWFAPAPLEMLTLALLFLLFEGFWAATGFISSLFIMIHAVFGLPFFENEFVGVLQLKSLSVDLRGDEPILQNVSLILTLLALVTVVHAARPFMLNLKSRKEPTLP